MYNNFFISYLLFIVHSFQFSFIHGDISDIAPWPLPQQHLATPEYFSLDVDHFEIIAKDFDLKQCDVLQAAFERYTEIIRNKLLTCTATQQTQRQENSIDENSQCKEFKTKNYIGVLRNLTLTVKNFRNCNNEIPQRFMDEMYTLRVNTQGFQKQAFLFANNIWGALRGLETFTQLLYTNDECCESLFINSTITIDYPRFTHRGLLLDTSRHFLSMKILKENLDLMEKSKLNVFHWHIVDDQSFPYESKAFANMSVHGAYSPKHVYTQANVDEIIEYARMRGIRVLAEFDSPGHTQSWGKSLRKFLTECYNADGHTNGQYGPVDASNEENYEILRKFFHEIANKFPDKYIHIGGDEVNFSCWKSNPLVKKFMKKMNFSEDYKLLENFYMQKVIQIIENLNKSYIVWQEVFDNHVHLDENAIVHVWLGGYLEKLEQITTSGRRAILSSPWYLNYIKYGSDWLEYYLVEPQNFTATERQLNLVEGGEACMWGEMVDGTNVIARTWPRAAAVAERLWSSKYVRDEERALQRIEKFRCYLLSLGYNVQPVEGPGYCKCDYVV